jgi:hypothetical protein
MERRVLKKAMDVVSLYGHRAQHVFRRILLPNGWSEPESSSYLNVIQNQA